MGAWEWFLWLVVPFVAGTICAGRGGGRIPGPLRSRPRPKGLPGSRGDEAYDTRMADYVRAFLDRTRRKEIMRLEWNPNVVRTVALTDDEWCLIRDALELAVGCYREAGDGAREGYSNHGVLNETADRVEGLRRRLLILAEEQG